MSPDGEPVRTPPAAMSLDAGLMDGSDGRALGARPPWKDSAAPSPWPAR